MLDKLRDYALATLAENESCTLSTSGPAQLQASVVRLAVRGGKLYLLIPVTSDHLFNLEQEPTVLLTTRRWQLRGTAVLLKPAYTAPPPDLASLFDPALAHTAGIVEVIPHQMHIETGQGQPHRQTIDF